MAPSGRPGKAGRIGEGSFKKPWEHPVDVKSNQYSRSPSSSSHDEGFNARRAKSETPTQAFRVGSTLRLSKAEFARPARASFRPQACVILPSTTQAFRNIFGPEPGPAQRAQIERCRQDYTDHGIKIFGEENVSKSDLFEAIEMFAKNGGSPLVLIGHSTFNAEGKQVLILPNAEEVLLSDLARQAVLASVPLYILTCHGRDFELRRKISYDTALNMWTEAMDSINPDVNGTAELRQRANHTSGFPQTVLSESVVSAKSEMFLEALSGGRSEKSRRLLITVAAPAGHNFSWDDNSADIIAWRIAMQRPDRALWITGLLIATLGLMHYTTWRDDERPVKKQPNSPETFRTAMVSAYRYARRWKVFALELFIYLAIFIGAYLLAFKEISMDREEGFSGGRHYLYGVAAVSLLAVAACFAVYITKSRRSLSALVARKMIKIPAGISFAWVCSVVSWVPGKLAILIVAWTVGVAFLLSLPSLKVGESIWVLFIVAMGMFAVRALVQVGLWTYRGYQVGSMVFGNQLHRSLYKECKEKSERIFSSFDEEL
jgi:hypothetical protein